MNSVYCEDVYKGASVLVTGASGFIGTHLCRQLRLSGAEVTGIYLNNVPGANGNWLKADLTDPLLVNQVVCSIKPDFIFHLASHVEGRRDIAVVRPTLESNFLSTVNILTAAQKTGCHRLVLANSQEEPVGVADKAVPASPYAAAKFAASTYARMFHALYRLPVVIARIFMVYGPEQKDLRKLVPYTILSALKGEVPELSSGRRRVDWIYVEDVVEGLLRLGCGPGLEGETVDLGSGRYHRVREVVELILKRVDPTLKGKFGAIADRPLELEPLADVAGTSCQLNWQAKVTLEQGLAQTIAWYRQANMSPE